MPFDTLIVDSIRTCSDVNDHVFTVVDVREAAGLSPYSIRFDQLTVIEQSHLLDLFYTQHFDEIAEVAF